MKHAEEWANFVGKTVTGQEQTDHYLKLEFDNSIIYEVPVMKPLPTLENLARLFSDETEFICELAGRIIFRCNRGSEVIQRYYSRYRVKKILAINAGLVQVVLDYPFGEEGKK